MNEWREPWKADVVRKVKLARDVGASQGDELGGGVLMLAQIGELWSKQGEGLGQETFDSILLKNWKAC
jgi:hypothetical protein